MAGITALKRTGYLHGGVTHPDGRRGFFKGAEQDSKDKGTNISPGTVGSGPNKSSSGATSTVGSLDSISVQTCKMFFLFTLSRSFLETLGHFSFKYFFTAPTVGNFLATFKNGFPEESLTMCKTAVICSWAGSGISAGEQIREIQRNLKQKVTFSFWFLFAELSSTVAALTPLFLRFIWQNFSRAEAFSNIGSFFQES